MPDMMTIRDASVWASNFLGKRVTPSNIAYLIQYGRIPRIGENGTVLINRLDLQRYYDEHHQSKAQRWKQRLGDDLNWRLSFSEYKEAETTKHVHRLHPYKGKFIPQLVEYFLDQHTDEFKRRIFFKTGDIVLDPFCGSGTTLVQANELGLHAVGVDVSEFNAFISNAKIGQYDSQDVQAAATDITRKLVEFQRAKRNVAFEDRLLEELKKFNAIHFPSPDFKYRIRHGEIDEKSYAGEKEKKFLGVYNGLIRAYKIRLRQENRDLFLDQWFLQTVRAEIDFVFRQIQMLPEPSTKKLLALVLSRTVRSCRATTHADLGTLKEPVTTTYYCKKHGKICKPLFSISSWWQRYTQDTIKRLRQFDALRTDTLQHCLVGDSRTLNLVHALESGRPRLAGLVSERKLDGIFSSPPYVGLIDYHEQHAYAYDLLGFTRNDALEIGPLCKGQGAGARQSYVEGIAEILRHCKKWLREGYNVLLVANDKYGLYPQIATLADMRIVNTYKRPVLNRVEKDRSAYAESIFHLREK